MNAVKIEKLCFSWEKDVEVLSDLEVSIEHLNGRVELGELPALEADPLQMRQLI